MTFVAVATAASKNDSFAKRTFIVGFTNALYGTMTEATSEPNEPYAAPPDRTIWWSWQAPTDGLVIVNPPANSSTTLHVYEGDSLWNLMEVKSGKQQFAFQAVAGRPSHSNLGHSLQRSIERDGEGELDSAPRE